MVTAAGSGPVLHRDSPTRLSRWSLRCPQACPGRGRLWPIRQARCGRQTRRLQADGHGIWDYKHKAVRARPSMAPGRVAESRSRYVGKFKFCRAV